LRVLLTCHHRLDADAGASGTTLALAAALERAGCEVELYGFQQAFGDVEDEGLDQKLRFPWKVAGFLRRRAGDFDVIDATSGDAWVWASLRRPGQRDRQVLITRTHGLEHVADKGAREAARNGGPPLSWKYPLYHGGLRLWEVRRSLVLADHCVVLNAVDWAHLSEKLHVAPGRLTLMPNGIAPHFLDAADAGDVSEGPLRLVFLGSWIARKGAHVLVEVVERLLERGLDFSLEIVGSGPATAESLGFTAEAAGRITVTPFYANDELPLLLEGREILVFPSLFEGSSIALLEAMACGLAPVATRVGAAPEVIEPGVHGRLVAPHDPVAVADAIEGLARDRPTLQRMRRAAQEKARGYGWDRIAEKTVRLYERLLTTRSTASTNRGPIDSQV
jgi:glycosyltransferase involved in cell wall biosynthesis